MQTIHLKKDEYLKYIFKKHSQISTIKEENQTIQVEYKQQTVHGQRCRSNLMEEGYAFS